MSAKASCLCGTVRIEVEGDFEKEPEACHCGQCRKQTGHFLAAVNVRRDKLTVAGEDAVKWYASSDKVDRGFCGQCGSTLFWKPNMDGYNWTAVAMGLFDTPTGLRIKKHTFVNDRGDYYDIDGDAPQSDGF